MSVFRVIIAGGSLVGLSLALVFERLGVDYVLLEKGQIAPQLGASLGLHPQSLKILDQLGVWKDIQKQIVPLLYREHLDGDGHVFEASYVIKLIEETYDISPLTTLCSVQGRIAERRQRLIRHRCCS